MSPEDIWSMLLRSAKGGSDSTDHEISNDNYPIDEYECNELDEDAVGTLESIDERQSCEFSNEEVSCNVSGGDLD